MHTHTDTQAHTCTHRYKHTSLIHQCKHRAEESIPLPISVEEQQADTGTYEKYVVAPRMFKAVVGERNEILVFWHDPKISLSLFSYLVIALSVLFFCSTLCTIFFWSALFLFFLRFFFRSSLQLLLTSSTFLDKKLRQKSQRVFLCTATGRLWVFHAFPGDHE